MKAADIASVAVIGAGTMGAGIAGLLARAGCDVRLVDQNDVLLERGMDILRAVQDGLRATHALSARGAAAALRRIEPTMNIEEACRGVRLAIEAVSEDLELKQRLFRRLDDACPRRAVLVSNTSGLSITAIARATRRPHLVAGMHFWNPPHLVPLVEVVKAEQTADATAKLLLDLSRRLGKRPILVRRDVPGFVGNRLQFAVFREALHLLASGVASTEDIDAAMTAGPGVRYGLLGPLRTADLGGLDVFLAISQYLFAELNSDSQPPPLLSALVGKGRLGYKTGGGFYDYSPRDAQQIVAQRDRVLLKFLQVLKEDNERG
jgi:3-hydroxybutyryl-CoA dehydrogenase